MVTYGPTVTNLNLIHEKASSRADGVYAFRGVLYLVQSGHFTYYAHAGEVLRRAGFFDVQIGRCESTQSEMRKVLLGLGSK